MVHQLDDIEFGIVVQCFEVVQISDNCSSRRCSRASYALSHAAAETIEPENEQESKQNTHHQIINYLRIIFNEFYSKEKFKWKCLNIWLVYIARVLGQVPGKICM